MSSIFHLENAKNKRLMFRVKCLNCNYQNALFLKKEKLSDFFFKNISEKSNHPSLNIQYFFRRNCRYLHVCELTLEGFQGLLLFSWQGILLLKDPNGAFETTISS